MIQEHFDSFLMVYLIYYCTFHEYLYYRMEAFFVFNLLNFSFNVLKRKITSPNSISYKTAPRQYQSIALVYGFLSSTSGAKYSGVPQKVAVNVFA